MKVQLEDILSKLQETVIQPQSDRCRIKYTLSIVNSKWNWMVIALLHQKEVRRAEFPQIPPKVEYTLTEKGKAIVPVLCEMYAWGENWQD